VQVVDTHAIAVRADSGDPAQLRTAVSEAATALGGLDILLNSAGILISGDVASYPQGDFDRMIDVNVRGVFVGVQEAALVNGASITAGGGFSA